MLGQRVVCPISPANQHIILQIVGFLLCNLKKDCMYTCSQNVSSFQSYGFCTFYVLCKSVPCVSCMKNIVFLIFRKHLHFVLLYGKYYIHRHMLRPYRTHQCGSKKLSVLYIFRVLTTYLANEISQGLYYVKYKWLGNSNANKTYYVRHVFWSI